MNEEWDGSIRTYNCKVYWNDISDAMAMSQIVMSSRIYRFEKYFEQSSSMMRYQPQWSKNERNFGFLTQYFSTPSILPNFISPHLKKK